MSRGPDAPIPPDDERTAFLFSTPGESPPPPAPGPPTERAPGPPPPPADEFDGTQVMGLAHEPAADPPTLPDVTRTLPGDGPPPVPPGPADATRTLPADGSAPPTPAQPTPPPADPDATEAMSRGAGQLDPTASGPYDVPTRAFDPAHDVTAPLPPKPPTPTPTPGSAPVSGGWGTISADGRLEPGEVVFGRYLVKKQLGRGGMGTVWLVRHLTLDTDRALKLIVANIAFDPEARGRFRREAQVMARFTHPNAVTVHDAVLTNDVAFIEMELVQGKGLNALIERGVPMPLDWVARILRQLCEVLQVAHDQGIVHRDLKPSNLMLCDGRPVGQEQLKVLDFGIAKILGADDPYGEVHTMTNAFMGTPPYTSPEQANGHADARSDVYSVGVILYELLTGFRPFSGPVARQIADTLHSPPPPFRALSAELQVPEAIEAVVQRCLAKDAAARPQTPRDLYEQFLAALPAGPAEAAIAPPRVEPPKSSAVPLVAGSLVALLLVVGGIAYGLRPTPEPVPVVTGNGGPAITSKDGSTKPETPPPGPRWDLPTGYTVDGKTVKPGDLPPALVHDGGARFVLLPGGSFVMGSVGIIDDPNPPQPHDEPIDPFYMQTTEVTNGQFRRYLRETRSSAPPEWQRGYDNLTGKYGLPAEEADQHPAVGIDYPTAAAYAAWAGGRLPTSAEWEYAAQSGGLPDRRYIWDLDRPPQIGTDDANIDSVDKPGAPTNTVGYFGKDRTQQGIVDMTGNVREWCREEAPGQQARPGQPMRYVVRGGSWNSNADHFVTTAFESVAGTEQLPDLGFRVVLNAPKPR